MIMMSRVCQSLHKAGTTLRPTLMWPASRIATKTTSAAVVAISALHTCTTTNPTTATTARDSSASAFSATSLVTGGLLLVTATSGIALSSSSNSLVVASCEAQETINTPPTDTTTATTAGSKEYKPAPNPVWPQGIADSDIDALVEDCLKDPSINIQTVPDYLERQIYKSTIKLTLNAIYQSLASVHGMPVLGGHELQIVRQREPIDVHEEFFKAQLRDSVQEDVLEKVVDGLLQNSAINLPLVPDVVERQLYGNCLKLIFRCLDMVFSTASVTCCGHVLRVTLEPSQSTSVQESAISMATKIDPAYMLQYARQMGIHPENEVEHDRSWLDKFFRPTQKEFMAQLHATLYCLVLGIMDDVLGQTKIRLLSDTLEFDVVAVPLEYQQQKAAAAAGGIGNSQEVPPPPPPTEPSVAFPLATFTAGMGIGLVLHALLEKRP